MYLFCDVIIFKLDKKGSKVVYNVSRVIERSKSIFDGTLKRGECVFVINLSKLLQFYVIIPKLGQKGSELVFHISMAIKK